MILPAPRTFQLTRRFIAHTRPPAGYFKWNTKERLWQRRKKYSGNVDSEDIHRKSPAIGRLCSARPGQGELFSLYRLLLNTPGAKSFEYLRTVQDEDGASIVTSTFRDACIRRGLTQSDQELIDVMNVAVSELSPSQARDTFCDLLMWAAETGDSNGLWLRFERQLSDDFAYRARDTMPDEELRRQLSRACALAAIHSSLVERGAQVTPDGTCLGVEQPNADDVAAYVTATGEAPPRCTFLDDGATMPPESRAYLQEQSEQQRLMMTDQQAEVYRAVMSAIDGTAPSSSGKAFLLACSAGCGKTFVTNCLAATVRSRGGLCLAMAASGVAASLIDNATTFHSASGASVNEPVADMSLPVSRASLRGQRLIRASLIIIDEVRSRHFLLHGLSPPSTAHHLWRRRRQGLDAEQISGRSF